MADQEFNPQSILEAPDRHGVEYVLVGGLGARAHGALLPTSDIDCVPSGNVENLERLAEVLQELGARLRVGGMTDDGAQQLPVHLDAATLRAFGSSTWMTDAGPLDLPRELPDRQGSVVAFDELRNRSNDQEIGGVVVHVAGIEDIIAAEEHAGRARDREALRTPAPTRRPPADDLIQTRCAAANGKNPESG